MKTPPTWDSLNLDTPRKFEVMQISLYQTLEDWQKIDRVKVLNSRIRRVTLDRLRESNPHLSEQMIKWLMVKEFYGAEVHGLFYAQRETA